MGNLENTLSDYRRIEAEVRTRAKTVKLEYTERIPQGKWLRLDLDGAVLLTPAEFSQLPQLSREFFLDGNTSHYRNDGVAMRGERTILLDGYYSGGPKGEMRVDDFLETAQRYQRAVPETLRELSDDQEGPWKAKLAVWDNLTNLSVAQYHALKVRVSPDDLDEEPNGIFITDVSSCEDEAIHNQTEAILKRLNSDGGVFVLSLGGPRTPSLNHIKLDSMINSFRYNPQIVFSNVDEFRYFTRIENIESSLFNYFSSAR